MKISLSSLNPRVAIFGLVGLATATIAQTPVISVKNLMTVSEFNAAGLNKLTPAELNALDRWFVRTVVNFTPHPTVRDSGSAVPGTYPVEAAVNDETFIIKGEVFKAQTHCFNVNRGDRVKFVDGGEAGGCVAAKFLNIRTGDVCAVWCE